MSNAIYSNASFNVLSIYCTSSDALSNFYIGYGSSSRSLYAYISSMCYDITHETYIKTTGPEWHFEYKDVSLYSPSVLTFCVGYTNISGLQHNVFVEPYKSKLDGTNMANVTDIILRDPRMSVLSNLNNANVLSNFSAPYIEQIASYCFTGIIGSKSLTSFNWPRVRSIGAYVFRNSTRIQELTLQSIKEIDSHAFAGQGMLKKININSTETFETSKDGQIIIKKRQKSQSGETVVPSKLIWCSNAGSIKQYANLTEDIDIIGEASFYQTKAAFRTWKSVSCESALSIEENAFYNDTNLSNVYFPNVKWIGDSTFNKCILKKIDFPCAEYLGSYAFNNITAAISASFPKLKHISDNAFNGCNQLSLFYAPYAASIESCAFENCLSIMHMNLSSVSRTYVTENDNFVDWGLGYNTGCRISCANDEVYVIDGHVVKNILSNCTNSNTRKFCDSGDSYYGTIVPFEHYNISSIEVSVDSNRIEVVGNEIDIPDVSGHILIKAYAIGEDTDLHVFSNNDQYGIALGSGTYKYGTVVTISAIENNGYEFINWSNGSTEPYMKIQLSNDTYLTANFDVIDCTKLKFKALENNSSIKLCDCPGTYKTSTNGIDWQDYEIGTLCTLTSIGDAVYFSAKDKNQTCYADNSRFKMTGKIAAYGNIQCLLDATGECSSVPDSCYKYIFSNCTSLTQAPALPATILASNCYSNMFYKCTSLTSAPVLPATTLADYCYTFMFSECSSLTQAPALPATTLADYCYGCMFSGCNSLIQAPTLPATTLVEGCYWHMFEACISLSSAPNLIATTLAEHCYECLFINCSSFNDCHMNRDEKMITPYVYGSYYGIPYKNIIKDL